MAIDKPMYPIEFNPEGGEYDPDAEDMLVEIDAVVEGGDDLMVELDDGSVEITLGGNSADLSMIPFDANLVDYLPDDVIQATTTDLLGLVDADEQSRKEWEETLVKGLDTLGLHYEERTEPWQGACGVFSTVLAEAAIRFQAESMSESFPAAGPVQTKIIGEETREKIEAALRVKNDMNYELTEKMAEYRPEHERMLYSLGLMGSAFKKVYMDPALGRQTSVYISAEDILVPYGASNIVSCERVTHRMRKTVHEMEALQYEGFYADIELDEPTAYHSELEKKKAEDDGFTLSDDNRYTLYEIHTRLRIEGLDSDDEPAKPYIVTVERGTETCLAIRRNWLEADVMPKPRAHFVHYVYIPGFGFYGMGLIHIIGGYAQAGTSIIRQLVDAGTLSNLPGGMKTRGMRVKGDDTPIEPGEWRDVDVPSGTLRENLMPLPYKEPSQVLMMLLDRITDEGRRLGAISDMKISDMSAQAPVGTTLALLERTLKPMAAVQARVHYAMKQEFKLLKAIIAENAPQFYEYDPVYGESHARREDYDMVEVIPVSDPNSTTMAQRVVQYQAVLQMAQMAPQIYDLPLLHRQMVEVMGIKNADKLIPMATDAAPADPISENMNALIGKPMQAFIYQDHDAHMATHVAFMQDPMIMQAIGQNPMAQQIMGSLQAHIAEHLGFAYRRQMEERLGVTLPTPNEELPEMLEVELSRAVAEGAKQLTQMHQQQAAQQQAEQQQQDPEFQLRQKETQIKEQEVQRKAVKDKADIDIKEKELELKDKAITLDAALESDRLGLDSEKVDKKIKADITRSAISAAKPTTRRR